MSSGDIFELQIAKFVEKAQGNIELVLRKVSFQVFSQVVVMSPVDEGRFKSSWLVSVNAVPTGDPGTIDKSGAPSFARINAAVLQMKAGDFITMTSNLEYSRPLEYGHSKQAPAGMVRLTVSQWNAKVNAAAASLPK